MSSGAGGGGGGGSKLGASLFAGDAIRTGELVDTVDVAVEKTVE